MTACIGHGTRNVPRAAAWKLLSTIILLTTGCAVVEDREQMASDYLGQRVATESGGALILDAFTKTNAYEQNAMGLELYVLEWQGQLTAQQDIRKGGDVFVGYWQDFDVLAEGQWSTGSKRFPKGAKFGLNGTVTFQKTENGWRAKEYEVNGASLLNPGAEFVGTWQARYVNQVQDPSTQQWIDTIDVNPAYDFEISQAGDKLRVRYNARVAGSEWADLFVGAYSPGTIVGESQRDKFGNTVVPQIYQLPDGSLSTNLEEHEVRLRRVR